MSEFDAIEKLVKLAFLQQEIADMPSVNLNRPDTSPLQTFNKS